MHVTLRQLKVFETVARLGSFTRAAEELCLSQPTVSMQVKQLAESVDQPLFEQVGKKIHLTDMGRELYATAREVFDTWSRFEMTAADMKGLKKGRLRLACVTTAKYFVPRLLGPFSDRHPGIDIRLEVASREHIVERIGRSDDELTIMSMPPQALNVAQHAFLDNALVPIAPVHHPLSRRSGIPLQDFAAERLLLRERGSETRLATERFFRENGVELRARMEIGSNEAIKQAVAGGLGVTVISQHALLWEPMSAQITVLDVVGFPIRGAWYVVYPGERKLSVVAQAFFDYLGNDARLFDPMNTPAPRA